MKKLASITAPCNGHVRVEMKKIDFKILTGIVLVFCALASSWACFGQSHPPSQGNAENAQQVRIVIHLLEYIASDYPGAVRDGNILSTSEYAEMTRFSTTALKTARQITFPPGHNPSGILSKISQLQLAIRQKQNDQSIAALSDTIRQQIIDITGFPDAPSKWPDITRGKSIYALNCSSCHGMSGAGNGQLARNFSPPPADFTDDSLMADISAFQVYNTIRIGVMGTAMPPFPQLSEQDAWDIAFYIETLKFGTNHHPKQAYAHLFDQVATKMTLAEVATLSDHKLLERLGTDKYKAEQALIAIRSHSGDGHTGSLALASQLVSASVLSYQKGDFTTAKQKALAAYLDGIEPVEAQLRTKSPRFTSRLEQQMLGYQSTIDRQAPAEKVAKEADIALALISSAVHMLQGGKLTFWLAFLLSGSILLREGLEAFLIIAVILALVRKTGARKALWWIHGGWLIAIILGFMGWFLSDWVLNIGGQNREMMEGLVTLFAVCVLVSAGLWLHNKSHAKHWKKFVEEKIGKLLQKENMIGLGLFSFMVVFREAFESILFLQAVRLETTPDKQSAIGLGVLAALAAIALFVVVFLKFSARIPIRLLFRYSSWMIVVLAVILIGDGVHAIQEAGFIPVTPFAFHFQLDWLGLYPTTQTLIPQILLIALVTVIWYTARIQLRRSV